MGMTLIECSWNPGSFTSIVVVCAVDKIISIIGKTFTCPLGREMSFLRVSTESTGLKELSIGIVDLVLADTDYLGN